MRFTWSWAIPTTFTLEPIRAWTRFFCRGVQAEEPKDETSLALKNAPGLRVNQSSQRSTGLWITCRQMHSYVPSRETSGGILAGLGLWEYQNESAVSFFPQNGRLERFLKIPKAIHQEHPGGSNPWSVLNHFLLSTPDLQRRKQESARFQEAFESTPGSKSKKRETTRPQRKMWFRDAGRISLDWFLIPGHGVRPEKVLAGTDLLQVRSDRSLAASIFSINSFIF